VREVHHVAQTEDQRQTAGQDGEQRRQRQRVGELRDIEQLAEIHAQSLLTANRVVARWRRQRRAAGGLS